MISAWEPKKRGRGGKRGGKWRQDKSNDAARKVRENSKQRLVNAFIISDGRRGERSEGGREMALTSGEERAREWRVGGVETLLIPSSRRLNERRQCVLEGRLEGIKA